MKIGNKDVVASGTLVTLPGDTSIRLEHANLIFELVFTEEGEQQSVNGVVDGATLRLTFNKLASALGTAWYSEVGHLHGRKLFLSIYAFGIGDSEKIQRALHYTLSLEPV